nr:FMRFamide=neuropeptide [Lymnaea stagnalis=snails, Peptide, 7 aa] [Lymnaea stagnalis]
SKPYMRF